MPTPNEIRARFETKPPSPVQGALMAENRQLFADVAVRVSTQTAPNREQSLALTALEEAKFWANQAIMQNGLHGRFTPPRAAELSVPFSTDVVAQACHEANRALQAWFGDPVSPHWEDERDEIRLSAHDGIRAIVQGQVKTPEESHENWVRFKLETGWTLGDVKDADAKTHPLLVPYAELPPEQHVKDRLFLAIVRALVPARN